MVKTVPSRRDLLAAGVGLLGGLAGCTRFIEDSDPPADADVDVEFDIETVASGFTNPWAGTFRSERNLLLTERDTGDLVAVDVETGETTVIDGVPAVDTGGQGGLLDIALHPDYPAEPYVYLTYAATNDAGETATHLVRGELDREATSLAALEQIYVAEPFMDSTDHYGSRVVFGTDGMLYQTLGDRGDKTFDTPADHISQDTTTPYGSTLRLAPDGSIPADNPFVDEPGILDEIYTYGHRNAQGMAVHPETGELWQSEHGEQDGDEINLIEAGGNYGWPVTHTGCEYRSDDPVGDRPEEHDDIVNPRYYWECNTGGFPPAGATFYDGDAFPAWQGNLFIGNLAGRYLGIFSVDGHDVTESGAALADENWRIRDVVVGPEGYLYVVVDSANAPLVRLVPS